MLLIILLSLAAFIFIAGNAVRVVRFLRMSAPLRWELYPIPKGPRERQRYGGSYFEDPEWWTQAESSSHRGELAFMAKEVLLLRSVREGFRELWGWSWLLHWGLYLYAVATVLTITGFLLNSASMRSLAVFASCLACLVGLMGGMGVLVLRTRHPRLRTFTTRITIFNLLLLAAIFASGVLMFTAGATLADAIVGVIRHVGPVVWFVHVALVGFFLAWFPFTHMTHAYMKFFTWHGVRWNDAPAAQDPHATAKLAANLQRKVTWAAPHIAGDGPATWSDVVADKSERGAAKRA